jgi:hypothetical protein
MGLLSELKRQVCQLGTKGVRKRKGGRSSPLAVTLLAHPADGCRRKTGVSTEKEVVIKGSELTDTGLLAAHDEIGVVARHGGRKTARGELRRGSESGPKGVSSR